MGTAFNGSTEAKSALVGRLAAHADAKRLVPGAFRWSGEQGSLVGCLLENPDPACWETELGLPQWLALVADKLAEGSGSPESAAALGARLLQAIRPGVDLEPVGSRFILRLLADLQTRLSAPAGTAAQALAEVEQLHRSVAAGEQVPAPQWRAVRRAATAATDELKAEDEQALALLKCVETAAWNPASSPVVVYDTLRTWVEARTLIASIDAGWRSDYEPTLRAHLQEMFETYIKDNPELQKTKTVFDFLEEHYPDDARMIRVKNQVDRDAHKDAYPYAADLLIDLLKAA